MANVVGRLDTRVVGTRTWSHLSALALLLSAPACASEIAEDEGRKVAVVEQAVAAVGGRAQPTDYNYRGAQYSVSINGCSGQMINKWYALTAGHCIAEGRHSNIRIGRVGPLVREGERYKNFVEVYNGLGWAYRTDLRNSRNQYFNHSGSDVAIIRLARPIFGGTCEDGPQQCWNDAAFGRKVPWNARVSLDEKERGSGGKDLFLIYGWGQGYNAGAFDPGYSNLQRFGVLHNYGTFYKPTVSQGFAQVPPYIPRVFAHTSVDTDYGYGACAGDSGAPWLYEVDDYLMVSFGINHSDMSNRACKSSGIRAGARGTAFAHMDYAIPDFIFQKEIAVYGEPRFSCTEFSVRARRGDVVNYWMCDNGGRFSDWHPDFYERRWQRGQN